MPAKSTRPVTHVAVGVVFSPDGRELLFGQRPQGKPYAGWWEFPGGKLEAGETVEQALTRELFEELGITATKIARWAIVEHDYPHAYVRLHFCRVLAFTGTPSSKENQALRWLNLERDGLSSVEPMLPAAKPVLAWLSMPNEIWISRFRLSGPKVALALLERRAQALVATPRTRAAVLLDDPLASHSELTAYLPTLTALCQRYQLPLLLSDCHVALAQQVGHMVQGVHCAKPVAGEPNDAGLRGTTVGSAAELVLAADLGFDYALFSPQAVPFDWQQFAAITAQAKLPVFASVVSDTADVSKNSSLDEHRDDAWQYGAHGIAAP